MSINLQNDNSLDSAESQISNLSLEDINLFVGKKAGYYITKWSNMGDKPKISWNWAAFFFNIVWLFYRKMYFIGASIIAVIAITYYLFPSASVGVDIVCGLYGNYWYKEFTKKKVIKIKSSYTDREIQKTVINEAGGTTWLGVIGAVVIILIVAIIL